MPRQGDNIPMFVVTSDAFAVLYLSPTPAKHEPEQDESDNHDRKPPVSLK
jgi:hypothetical protein